MNFPSNVPNFEETPTVAIKQGGVAEVGIDGVNEAIDRMANTAVILVEASSWRRYGYITVTYRLFLYRPAREIFQRSKP